MSEFDAVKHPSHYTEGREYEPRKVIMDWGLDFYLGNVVKYISRAGRKNDILEDLCKARQYLEWEIEMYEEKEAAFKENMGIWNIRHCEKQGENNER